MMVMCDDGDVCVVYIYKCHVAYISISMRSVDAVGRSVVPLSSHMRACRCAVPSRGRRVVRRTTTQSVRQCVVSCRVVSCRRTCGSQRNELANDDDDDDDDDDDGFFGFDEEEEDDDDDEADDDDDDASWTTRRRMRAPMR